MDGDYRGIPFQSLERFPGDLVKLAGRPELAEPGFLIILSCHVVVGMVPCHNHHRAKNNILIPGT